MGDLGLWKQNVWIQQHHHGLIHSRMRDHDTKKQNILVRGGTVEVKWPGKGCKQKAHSLRLCKLNPF